MFGESARRKVNCLEEAREGALGRLEKKLDAVLQGLEEVKTLMEELRDHPAADKLQEGIDNILGWSGPKGGGAE